MSKTKAIEEVVLTVLSDGEWHQIQEFKTVILEKNPAVLEKANSLSVTLYQMKEKKMIEMKKRGVYRLTQKESVNETNLLQSINKVKKESIQYDESENRFKELKKRMLQGWRTYYKQYECLLQPPSYEMTKEAFEKGQWLYGLNKEVEQLIISYKGK